MFTGIVEKIVKIELIEKVEKNIRIAIELEKKRKVKIGDSVSVSGVCLTIADQKDNLYFFDIIPETLSKTIFGKRIPEVLNIERSLLFGSRVHGHIVSGHVDCVGKVLKISDDKNGYQIEISYPKKFNKFLKQKGSITIDGVSLTVVKKKSLSFVVALIPHTLKITTLSGLKKGDFINLEFDKNIAF